jgi:hypothetical protein
MNPSIPYTPKRSYSLEEDLQEKQDQNSWASTLDSEAEELLFKKLGARGWGRLLNFSRYYSFGWGEGNRALSPKGQDVFLRFLKEVHFRAGASPSIFLTDEGSLELVWQDENNQAIQIEFGSFGIEVYHEARGREERVGFNEYSILAKELSNI